MSRIRNRFAKLDPQDNALLRGAGLAFLLRGAGAGLAFVFNVVIARLLGAQGAGLYFLALSLTMIASVIARRGLDGAMLRFIAAAAATDATARINAVFRIGMLRAFIGSVTASIALIALANPIANHIFNDPSLAPALRWVSPAIISFSVMSLLAECLKGLRLVAASMLVSGVIYPIAGIALAYPMITAFGAAGAAMTYSLATAIAAAYGLVKWRSAMRGQAPAPDLAPTDLPAADPTQATAADSFDPDELTRSARPLWVSTLITRAILPWAPLLLLGLWGSATDTGIFGAASRLANLMTFFLVAVNTVLAPRFAALYHHKDLDQLARIARKFSLLITAASAPALLLMIFANGFVMSLFGPEFRAGGTALAILALGQAVNAVTGPVGNLLIMSGYERDLRTSSVVGVVVMALAALILMPSAPLIGAAVANALSIATSNIFASVLVYKRLGFWALPIQTKGKLQ